MKILLSALGAASVCAVVGASALNSTALAGDNDKITQTLDLSGFERISISGVYELDVEVGPDYAITLTGRERALERVDASVKNGTLRLGQKERKKKRINLGGTRDGGIDAVITMPSLSKLSVSGVVDGEIKGIDAETFEISVSGVGDMDLEGECGALEAEVSGVGDLEAKKLECRSVKVEVSGVGSASVYASEAVDAEVSGMGDIDVYGSPSDVRKDGGMFADVTVH